MSGPTKIKLRLGKRKADDENTTTEEKQKTNTLMVTLPLKPPQKEKVILHLPNKVIEKVANEVKSVMRMIQTGDYEQALVTLTGTPFDPNGLAEFEFGSQKIKWSLLHCSSFYGNIDLLKLFVSKGGDLEQRDGTYGGTCLSWACFGNQPLVAKMLIEEMNCDPWALNGNKQKPKELVATWTPEWESIFPDESACTDQKIMQAVIKIMSNYKDKGRNISEIFKELPSRTLYPHYYEIISRPICLKMIHAKRYSSFEPFAADFVQMFENGLVFNQEGSVVYKDSLLLLNVFASEMAKYVKVTSVYLGKEFIESHEQYKVGDFVYVSTENVIKVIHIEKMWVQGTNLVMFGGCPFLFPEQVYHAPSRKFYKNEVFKTATYIEGNVSQITGHCMVMHYKDFAVGFPKGFQPQDVFVCESKYADTTRNISTVRDWPKAIGVFPQVTLVPHPDGFRLEKTEPSIYYVEKKKKQEVTVMKDGDEDDMIDIDEEKSPQMQSPIISVLPKTPTIHYLPEEVQLNPHISEIIVEADNGRLEEYIRPGIAKCLPVPHHVTHIDVTANVESRWRLMLFQNLKKCTPNDDSDDVDDAEHFHIALDPGANMFEFFTQTEASKPLLTKSFTLVIQRV